MKSIDIIEAMVSDSNLAEAANVFTYVDDEDIEIWFGDVRVKKGELHSGESYLAVFSSSSNDIYPFHVHNKPEVVLERTDQEGYDEDDLEIYLWMIDNY